MTEKKKVTMKDVANAAGVTIGTVSHVINGTTTVSEKTKAEVWRVIRETGYTPNPMARYMRSKKSNIIGLFLPDLTNFFFAKTASVFADLAYQHGYTVLILENGYSVEKEKQNVQILINNHADAAVVLCGFLNDKCIQELQEEKIQIVYADSVSPQPDIPYVCFDNRAVFNEIASYAVQNGYTSVGYFSEPPILNNLSVRFENLKNALKSHAIPYREDCVFLSEKLATDHLQKGYAYMKEILQIKSPDMLPKLWITSSDLSAIGAIRAFKEAGIRVPNDMAVIGWDNLEISESISPSLTTVYQDQEKLGRASWSLLTALLHNQAPESITLPQEIIFRESCPQNYMRT